MINTRKSKTEDQRFTAELSSLCSIFVQHKPFESFDLAYTLYRRFTLGDLWDKIEKHGIFFVLLVQKESKDLSKTSLPDRKDARK